MANSTLQTFIEKYPFDTLSTVAYRYLYDQIITLKIKPGAKLNISQLANELDMSRTTIREAITLLIADKLVVRQEGSKLRISALNASEMFNVYHARRILELQAAHILCEFITDDEIALLKKYAEDFQRGIEMREYFPTFEADKNFHRVIIDHCRNDFIKTMHQSIAGTIDRYQSFGTVVLTSKAEDHYPYFASPVNQHFMLVNAFKTRIPDHVAYILRRHLDDAIKVLSYSGTELKI